MELARAVWTAGQVGEYPTPRASSFCLPACLALTRASRPAEHRCNTIAVLTEPCSLSQELTPGLGPDGIFMEANRTAIGGGSASGVGLPQHTEFVTPDYFTPGSMPSAPSKSTAVFMSSVYGYAPCCDAKFGARWNYQVRHTPLRPW